MPKFKSKLIVFICLLIYMFTMLSQVVFAIDIGDDIYLERTELGFYTLQYWNESKSMWYYINYSRVIFDDYGTKRIAYCVDPNLDGVGFRWRRF